MVYRALMAGRALLPAFLEGSLVVLRRHAPENLEAFRRWYADPEIARLARYTEGPMRIDEVDRFFHARAMGPESMAMAIHVRGTDRLVGTCALSQMDGDHGSALYHITIGEKDAWGNGYGTEATRLMVAHAFETLGLHRIALTVFAFNERAKRSYEACGFTVEGRAREAIRRDGQWWDEILMSILASEWVPTRENSRAAPSTTSDPEPATSGPAPRRGVVARITGR